jgi:hypothetical protein
MAAHGGDDGLQIVAAFAGHAHFVTLNLLSRIKLKAQVIVMANKQLVEI